MRGTFRLNEPDKVEASMTITMPLAEWKRLREQLSTAGWPAVRLADMIGALVRSAETHFSEAEKDAP